MTSETQRAHEPMTDAQASYLRTLCDDVGEPFDPNISKEEASVRIDELQARSPRLGEDSRTAQADR